MGFSYKGSNVNVSADSGEAYWALSRSGFLREYATKAEVKKRLMSISNELPIGAEVRIEKIYHATRGFEPNAKFRSGEAAEEETLRLVEYGSFYDPATGRPRDAKWARVSRSHRDSGGRTEWKAFEESLEQYRSIDPLLTESGTMVQSPTADRRRWDELHAAHAVARTAVHDYDRQLGPKYGWSQSWRSWITKTERDKLDRLEAKRDKIGDKIIELLVRVSPRGEAWLSGVPTWWIKEKLTWEDAVRPTNEPLSVEVPTSWGNTQRLTESTVEACTCEKEPPRPMKAKSRLDLILDRVVAGEREVTIDTDGYTTDQVDRIIATAKGRGFNASYDGRFVLIRDMRIPTHRRGQETQESEVNDDSRTNHVLTLIARRDRRDWSQMPFGYERDAVKAAYQDIKSFFDQRDVSARIAASKAATFDELRQAVSRMQNID